MSEVDDPHIKPGVGRKEQWPWNVTLRAAPKGLQVLIHNSEPAASLLCPFPKRLILPSQIFNATEPLNRTIPAVTWSSAPSGLEAAPRVWAGEVHIPGLSSSEVTGW
jgi:hypothetical protein